jgi:hypothetical protein
MARLQFRDHAPARRRRTTRDQEPDTDTDTAHEGSTKQYVATFPPAHERDPRGGSYSLETHVGGVVHVFFLPGGELDPGDTSADSVREMTGDAWNPIRPKDRDPVIVRLNQRNRQRYGFKS